MQVQVDVDPAGCRQTGVTHGGSRGSSGGVRVGRRRAEEEGDRQAAIVSEGSERGRGRGRMLRCAGGGRRRGLKVQIEIRAMRTKENGCWSAGEEEGGWRRGAHSSN